MPGANDDVVIVDGHTITIDLATVTCNSLSGSGSTGCCVISHIAPTLNIPNGISYSGSLSAGFLQLPTNKALTINSTLKLISNASGRLLVTATGGNSPFTITAPIGKNALEMTTNSGTGMVVNPSGSSVGTITGNLTTVGTNTNGYILNSGSTGAVTVEGNVSQVGVGYGCYSNAAGGIVIKGNLLNTGGGVAAQANGGPITWIGDRTLAAGETAYVVAALNQSIILASSTLTDALRLNCAGRLLLRTFTTTGTPIVTSSGNYLAAIRVQRGGCCGWNYPDISSIVRWPINPSSGAKSGCAL